jgi:Derlin-2/3
LKGGNSNGDSNIEDENDDNNDDDDDNIELGENSNLNQNKLVTSLTDMWTKTPPITQAYIGSSVVFTTLSFLLNKNIWPEFLHLEWKHVITGFQFWRPFTAFLFYGPLGLNYILTIQFVWTYMAQLEKLSYKTPADFFIQMVFGASTLLVLYMILGISPKYLGHNLSTFLVYIWARVFEGSEVNVMDLFNLKAEILPWFFCLQTFILEGEFPFADILGIVVGHLYHYLSKRKLLVAPGPIKDFFSSNFFAQKYSKFKEDFE